MYGDESVRNMCGYSLFNSLKGIPTPPLLQDVAGINGGGENTPTNLVEQYGVNTTMKGSQYTW